MKQIEKGFARYTARTQYFLDTCSAVESWVADAAEHFIVFKFDPAVEVPVVPDGVYFDRDQAPQGEKDALAECLIHHEISRLVEAGATANEIADLHEINWIEGFDEGLASIGDFDAARRVAREKLAWYRAEVHAGHAERRRAWQD